MLIALDDPLRVADWGYLHSERERPAPTITAIILADAILSGRAPAGFPFEDWVTHPFKGAYADYSVDECREILKAMLQSDGAESMAMDALRDVVSDIYY